jgi:hypothetical protein
MAFKYADRVEETSTTPGTGTYTVDGASPGRQSFVAGIGANNYCGYLATDDTNWELGIGQVLTGPNRLTRDKVKASSNGGAAVNWGSGTRKLRCVLLAEFGAPRAVTKSVAGGVDVTLTQDEQRCDILILTGALTANINVIVDTTPWRWIVHNNTSGAFTLTFKTSSGTGVVIPQGKIAVLSCGGTNVDHAVSGAGSLRLTSDLVVDGNLGVGASTPAAKLDVAGNVLLSAATPTITLNSGGPSLRTVAGNTLGVSVDAFTSETARYDANGYRVGTTNANPAINNVNGAHMALAGYGEFSRADTALYVNRRTTDGDIVALLQDGVTEGSISVSGVTVSYNAFLGSHWAQFEDGARRDLLLGTVLESTDKLCTWPGEQNDRLPCIKVSDRKGSPRVCGCFLAWDEDEHRMVQATREVEREEVSIEKMGERWTRVLRTVKAKEPIFTEHPLFNEDGSPCMIETRPAVVDPETGEEKEPAQYAQAVHREPVMVKRQGTNDLYAMAIGAGYCRMDASVPLAGLGGMLLMSAGNGCAIPWDGVNPAAIVGKVSAAIKVREHPDGSYVVPTVLYCG